ncbi:MAG: SUMF1/EgtB/PvdO family nonheme iron enzyme [Spirochaetota bacterium]
MKTKISFLAILILSAALAFTTCGGGGGSSKNGGSTPPPSGTVYPVSTSGIDFNIIYVRGGLTFPAGEDDSGTMTVENDFYAAETEATNTLVTAVFQWAYDNNKFDTDGDGDLDGDDNAVVNDTVVSLYGAPLLDVDEAHAAKIFFDGSAPAGSEFSILLTYEENPCVNIGWHGAIMFCNWLTEMVNGNASQAVYSWTDNGDGDGIAGDEIWHNDETDADYSKFGFRLPEESEWEFAARYLGNTAPSTGGSLDSEKITTSEDGLNWYWTPGDYASGASEDVTDYDALDVVAWFGFNGTGNTTSTKNVGLKISNILGIFDMSGNVWEWCYTEGGMLNESRIIKGGSWREEFPGFSGIGRTICPSPFESGYDIGFRIFRSAK